jgi:RNA polymerase sigma-70 factor (ECF subfamily)
MDEKQLIGRCIQGDNAAWKAFLHQYGGYIYGTIVNLLRTASITEPETASDVFAGVIKKLVDNDYRALRGFRWNSRFTTWLVSITRNKTYDYLRSAKRQPAISLNAPVDDDQDELGEIIASDLDLERDIDARMTAEEVLDRVAPKERLILRLYYLEGMKEREIAGLLSLSVDAVSARKSRALKKLKKMLGKGRRRTSDKRVER